MENFTISRENGLSSANKVKQKFYAQSRLCQEFLHSEKDLDTRAILDSPYSKNVVTKYGVRWDLAIVTQVAKSAGYPISGVLLQHSLQDNFQINNLGKILWSQIPSKNRLNLLMHIEHSKKGHRKIQF